MEGTRFTFSAPVVHKFGTISRIVGDAMGETEQEAKEMFIRNIGKMGWTVTGEIEKEVTP